VQGFFTHFLQDKIYAQADSARGQVPTFLLASLKNYIVDIWHRENTLKRGGGREFVVLDTEIGAVEKLYQDETVVILEEERHYEQRWATTLVTRALERLRADFSGESKAKIFEELKPFVSAEPGFRVRKKRPNYSPCRLILCGAIFPECVLVTAPCSAKRWRARSDSRMM
jgi:hypothetical protein